MKVKEYMSSGVVSANLRDGIRQTYFRMQERSVRHMPVLDEHERIVGILSDRDLRRPDWLDTDEKVAHFFLLDNSITVEETMSKDVVSVFADDDIQVANDRMIEHRYGALPVIDEKKHVIGMLSAHDMLRAFRDYLNRS